MARALPKKPFKEQKTADCNTKDAEVRINGGCWVETAKQAPCPDALYEHEGKCYIPVAKPKGAEAAIRR